MLQLVGIGAPLLELFARFVVWLYMPALMCFLIGYKMLKEGLLVLIVRRDLQLRERFRIAQRLAFGAVQGFVAGVIVILVIYYRKELFQCVTGLF